MHSILARNVNDASVAGIDWLLKHGNEETSRNGPVRVAPCPVMTVYSHPQERVLLAEARNANVFFHLYEAIWMLAGRAEVGTLTKYVARMREYSDNGSTLRGAYGRRWRSHFGYDQIRAAADELRKNPTSRRVVTVMYDPTSDAAVDWKDVPCNTHIYWRVNGGRLDMTVCCRSNDIIWGAYGANAVHFSVLQEVLASMIGAQVGVYYQLSNNFHLYTELPGLQELRVAKAPADYPIVIPIAEGLRFIQDAEALTAGGLDVDLKTRFAQDVVRPMLGAHAAWKSGNDPYPLLKTMPECDWRVAADAWFKRRKHGGQ